MIESKLFKYCAYVNVKTIYNTFFYLYILKKILLQLKSFILSHVIFCMVYFGMNSPYAMYASFK